jgi:hypothetical protein
MVEVVSKLGSFMQLHSLLHRRYPYPYPYPDLELGWIGDQPLSGVACRSLRPSDCCVGPRGRISRHRIWRLALSLTAMVTAPLATLG